MIARLQVLLFTLAVGAHAGYIEGNGLSVGVHSEVSSGSNSDSISYTETLLLTISGGSGIGLFEPIAHVRNTWSDSDVSAAIIRIGCGAGCEGSLRTDYSWNTSYDWYGKGGMLPFRFGVPISLEITLNAHNFGAAGLTSEASIDGFALVDAKVNQLVPGGIFVTQAMGSPEPNTFWLLTPLAVFYRTTRRRFLREPV